MEITNIANLTFNQYREAALSEICEKYHCSRKEALDDSKAWILQEYCNKIKECVNRGEIIKRAALDSLPALFRRHIFHDFPGYLKAHFQKTGKAYVDPEFRHKKYKE